MEIVLYIILTCFVALLIVTAVTFGFALLGIFMAAGLIVTAIMVIRQAWYRWRFIHDATEKPRSIDIIEVDYEDVSHKQDK